jgi:hypothetical protein
MTANVGRRRLLLRGVRDFVLKPRIWDAFALEQFDDRRGDSHRGPSVSALMCAQE